MDEKDWYLFKVLDEVCNITSASKILYVSQPSISLRIKRLEESLGVKLITRSSKGIQLTREGKYMAEYSRKMLKKQKIFKEELLNLDNKIQGTLSLAVSSSYTEYILPLLLTKFSSIYPDVQISLKTGWSYEIIDLMKNEQAHVGIFRGDYEWKEGKITIGNTDICVISNYKVDINKLPFYNRINYQTDPQFAHLLNNWWNQNFATPSKITMDVDSVTTCKELVRNGLGYGIVTEDYLYDHEKKELNMIKLTDLTGQKITRKTSMIYSEKAMKSSVVKAFVRYFEQL